MCRNANRKLPRQVDTRARRQRIDPRIVHSTPLPGTKICTILVQRSAQLLHRLAGTTAADSARRPERNALIFRNRMLTFRNRIMTPHWMAQPLRIERARVEPH